MLSGLSFRSALFLVSTHWFCLALAHLAETNLVPRAILKKWKTSFSLSSYSEKMCWGQGWTEASLSAFSWLFIIVCAVVQKYHAMFQSRFKSRLFGLHVSLRFSGTKFLINLRRQFRVRKLFFVYVKFFVHKFLRDLQLFRKCITYVLGCSPIKTCSLTGC